MSNPTISPSLCPHKRAAAIKVIELPAYHMEGKASASAYCPQRITRRCDDCGEVKTVTEMRSPLSVYSAPKVSP